MHASCTQGGSTGRPPERRAPATQQRWAAQTPAAARGLLGPCVTRAPRGTLSAVTIGTSRGSTNGLGWRAAAATAVAAEACFLEGRAAVVWPR
eukprot:6329163-Prymnesium_polylepis.1